MKKKPTQLHREICRITDAQIGFESHGILTVMLQVEYGGCVAQGIGGWALSDCNLPYKRATAVPRAADLLIRLMRACNVEKFHQLKGRTVLALFEGDHMPLNTMPVGIAPLPVDPGEEFLFADWQAEVMAAIEKASAL